MKKQRFYFLIICLILIFPIFIFADGGMIIWPPEIHLDQSAQNAIVAWNGKEEIIILSNDIKSDSQATALRIVPLPSNPSEIKEGGFDSFEKLVEIMNEKIEEVRNQWMLAGKDLEKAPAAGVEITFHEKIGAHDITVVKVNDLDYFLNWIKDFATEKGLEIKEISSEFKEGVKSYLKRDIKYFVFDVIDTKEEESIKPLIYQFESNFLYYPILISGISEISESRAKIRVFLITEGNLPKEISGVNIPIFYWQGHFDYPVELTNEELMEISEDIGSLFESSVRVRTFDYFGPLKKFDKDLIFYPKIWQKHLGIGSYGDDVKILQQILINEGYWDSEAGATGYFGEITKNSLIKFQEYFKEDILKPLDLEKGTGYFGPKTKEFLEKGFALISEIKTWSRNLKIGMMGDDIKTLQEILIKEGVWGRPDIKTTGYFGQITREAVILFQEKYSKEILEPLGLERGTGFIGPSTRTYLEKFSKE
ncbi:DUF2330 domain-containing protein [Patescibacteria group bacterium]|nr:DUF2330 domain-containing protein [Patescibacteria group bacterium]